MYHVVAFNHASPPSNPAADDLTNARWLLAVPAEDVAGLAGHKEEKALQHTTKQEGLSLRYSCVCDFYSACAMKQL